MFFYRGSYQDYYEIFNKIRQGNLTCELLRNNILE